MMKSEHNNKSQKQTVVFHYVRRSFLNNCFNAGFVFSAIFLFPTS